MHNESLFLKWILTYENNKFCLFCFSNMPIWFFVSSRDFFLDKTLNIFSNNPSVSMLYLLFCFIVWLRLSLHILLTRILFCLWNREVTRPFANVTATQQTAASGGKEHSAFGLVVIIIKARVQHSTLHIQLLKWVNGWSRMVLWAKAERITIVSWRIILS